MKAAKNRTNEVRAVARVASGSDWSYSATVDRIVAVITATASVAQPARDHPCNESRRASHNCTNIGSGPRDQAAVNAAAVTQSLDGLFGFLERKFVGVHRSKGGMFGLDKLNRTGVRIAGHTERAHQL